MMTTVSILHISFEELLASVNLDEALLLELVEYGVVAPAQGERRDEWLFNASAVSTLNKARRIQQDLVVDWADIPLVLDLIEESATLRAENSMLKQRLSRFLADE